jgi:hypothetical protein
MTTNTSKGDASLLDARDLLHEQRAVGDVERLVGRDDVDVIGLDPDLVHHLHHGNGGGNLEHAGELAVVVRGQVEDDDVRRARVRLDVGKKLLEGLDAPGGRAEPHHERRGARGRPLPPRFTLLLTRLGHAGTISG